MRNFAKVLIVLGALVVFLAPGARAAGGNSNWLTKEFHHQAKPSKHPERDSLKARDRQYKANDRNAKQRQRVADKHPHPAAKDAKETKTPPPTK
jgi:hypothetical protein